MATSAVGSPYATRVEELRRVRREYGNLSLWAALISQPVLDHYRKFSPGVVRDMNADPVLRKAMRLYVVHRCSTSSGSPRSYCRAEMDDSELLASLDGTSTSTSPIWRRQEHRHARSPTRSMAPAWQLVSLRALPAAAATRETGREVPGDVYDYLASKIASQGTETAGYAWAFEGIELLSVRRLSRDAAQQPIPSAFLDLLGAWIARLPIPTGASMTIADASDELKVFAERILTRPRTRHSSRSTCSHDGRPARAGAPLTPSRSALSTARQQADGMTLTMPESIQITDVRLTEMPADQMTPAMSHSGVSWYRLALTVQNASDEPIHLISDIRRIRYDAASRVLHVQLSEHDAPEESPVIGPPMPPRYTMIGARDEATIVHPLSSPITFLQTSPVGLRSPTYVRLAEDVDSIECAVTYETEPPPPVVDLAALRVPDREPRPGTTLTASCIPPNPRRGDYDTADDDQSS